MIEYAITGRTLIIAQGDVDDSSFNQFLRFAIDNRERFDGALLWAAPGSGTLNGQQRKKFHEATRSLANNGRKLRLVALTESAVVRTAARLLGVMNPIGFAAHHPRDIDRALLWLGARGQAEAIKSELDNLQQRIRQWQHHSKSICL